MSDDRIAEIRKRITFADENKSVIRPTGFSWTIPGWQAHNDRTWLLAEVDRQRAEIERLHRAYEVVRDGAERLHAKNNQLRLEIERLHAERDTLLLDSRDFVRWFNRHYPDVSRDPDHPWCKLNDRLNAHADTLATFDSGVETKEEVGR